MPIEHPTTVMEAVQRGHHAMAVLAHRLNEFGMYATIRNRMSATCQMVAHDHHASIMLLVDQGLTSPAFALVRLVFEAYVRGLWLLKCASDREVQSFAEGSEPPRFRTMVAALELLEGFQSKTLSKAHLNRWTDLCAFTHTGALQARGWLSDDAIEPNYPPSVIVDLADFSTGVAIMSGIATTDIGHHVTVAEELGELMHEFGVACRESARLCQSHSRA